ncbi:MAG: hypothetical protein WDZ79_00215 [Candidatus Paceibacterota bacterium]
MMQFISQYFVDVQVIDGGLQFNMSYAMLILSSWIGLVVFRRSFRRVPKKK